MGDHIWLSQGKLFIKPRLWRLSVFPFSQSDYVHSPYRFYCNFPRCGIHLYVTFTLEQGQHPSMPRNKVDEENILKQVYLPEAGNAKTANTQTSILISLNLPGQGNLHQRNCEHQGKLSNANTGFVS